MLTLNSMTKCALASAVFFIVAAASATLTRAEEPQTITMTVHPKPTSRPALAIHLLPGPTELTPGNAAPVYLLAAELWERQGSDLQKPVSDEVAKKFGADPKDQLDIASVLMAAPLSKLASPELDAFLSSQSSALALVDVAALRETCQWDLPIREQGYMCLLPHLSGLRGAAGAVCVRSRRDLARGDVKGALLGLRANLAMARALDQQSFLVQTLVATSIASQTFQVLRELLTLTDAPNLYWPLADLPRPFTNIRTAIKNDRAVVFYVLPQLRKVRDETFTDADWHSLQQTWTSITTAEPPKRQNDLVKSFSLAADSVAMYPSARRYLIQHGLTPKAADDLPRTTLLARYLLDSFDNEYDEQMKWASLPCWQAMEGLDRAEKAFAVGEKLSGPNPLYRLVFPLRRAVFEVNRLDREMAATETVEALRDYAAAHDGHLPKTLDEIVETPIPADPTTGKSFVYKMDGQAASLESPPPFGGAKVDGLLIRITFVR